MASLRNNGGFSGGFNCGDEVADAGIELTLGLSLNGRFGVDRSKDGSQIAHSSSVSSFPPVGGSGGRCSRFPTPAVVVKTPARAYSLPSVAEVEYWRKRKEVQTMNRREAIRRRTEKMMIPRLGKGGDDSEDTNDSSQEAEANGDGNRDGVNGDDQTPPLALRRSVGSMRRYRSATSKAIFFIFVFILVGLYDLVNNEPKFAAGGGTALPVQAQGKGKNEPKQPSPRPDKAAAEKKAEEDKEAMLQMPTVTTVGNGPKGRKVNGLLYRYAPGEEVKILCVCHGNFMSPAEFVKHAGGEAVENPLQSIFVNQLVSYNPCS